MERKEEMATVAKNLKVYATKSMVFPFNISCRLARDHPFIFGMLIISMHILHSYWPVLFDFLVSSSPVFICTALLLGALLVYGEPNICENKEARAKDRTKVKEMKVELEGNKEIHGERKGYNVRELDNPGFHMKDIGKQAEGTVPVREAGGSIKTNKSDLKPHFDSSLGSSCRPLEGHDGFSGSEYDETENSPPDAVADIIPMLDELHPTLDSEAPQSARLSVDNSDAASNNITKDSESDYDIVEEEAKKQEDEDIIPMLDELHPILDSEVPQPAHLSVDNSDAASSNTTQDSELDYDSLEEEAEKQEDEEAQEENDDTNEAVVTWTEDDQKNLMDLVSSELKRNQVLENLISKRRARNFLSFHAEKNLIDVDSNDHIPGIEDLSHLHYQIPSISTPRCNPFDLPFDVEETMGLPPFPGSAPVLQPRRNPFELPLDQDEESDSLARETMNDQKFAPFLQGEMLYRRQESFTWGASFSGDCKEDSLDSRLKPYSAHESDSNSSIVDQDNHKDRLEVFNLENHMLSPENHVEPVEQASQSSNVVDSVDEHEDVDDHHAIQLNSSKIAVENHQVADAFGEVEMKIRLGESCSSDSRAGNLEVIEERDDESSSSFSEAYEKSSKNGSKDFSETMLSVPADSEMTNAIERPVDSQTLYPVHDSLLHAGKEFSSSNLVASDVQLGSSKLSSPSTLHNKKVSSEDTGFASVSRSMDENLPPCTTELWVAPPSLASVDEIEPRSREVTEISERDVIHVGLSVIHEDFAHPISPLLPEVMRPSRLSVDTGKDVAVEVDVLTSGMSPISTNIPEDFRVRKEHERILDPSVYPSSLSGLRQIEESKVVLSREGDKLISKSSSSVNIGKTKNIKKLMPVFQSSEKAGLKESDAITSYVSPFLTNNREDFRVRKKDESMIDPFAITSSLSGLQQIEEHGVGLSGEGDKLLPKSSSSFKIGKIRNIKKLMPVFQQFEKGGLKDSNVITSDVSPIPTNSLEVFRVRKESESMIDSSANPSSLSGLQQIEEHDLALSGEGDKLVSKSSSSLKIRKIKNIKKLMPVFQQSEKARLKDFGAVTSHVPEDFGVAKEHESIVAQFAYSSSSLSGVQQIEESEVGLSGDGDKLVSKSSSSFKIGKINKNIKKLMPVFQLSEKAGHKVSNAVTSHASLIPTNYSSEDVRVGKENDPPANSSSLSAQQQIEECEVGLSGKGDKLEADVSKSNSSFKIGRVKNIKKFW